MAKPLIARIAFPVLALALAGAVVWALLWRDAGQAQLEFSGPVMGTHYVAKVVAAPSGMSAAELKLRVERSLERVNALMSTYDPDSELSRFNRHRGDGWFPVSPETATVVGAALEISELTGGAFDVTVGPLVNLWGFGPDGPAAGPPAEPAIEQALQRVGHEKLALRTEPPALRKSSAGVYVDLSAIAKGYAVDQAARALDAAGVDNYLLEVGGELIARGRNAGGGPWRIAVERPLTGERSVQRVLALTDTAVATSGDYRNFFVVDGIRYSHTIDPGTGRPVPHLLTSVTVLEASAMRADALATAMLVLGPEQAWEFARRQDIAALMIVRAGESFEERATPRLRSFLEAFEDVT